MDYKRNKLVATSERLICPVCGGIGEVLNENHYLADSSIENRYMMCNRCFGTGKILKGNIVIDVDHNKTDV